MANIYLQVDFKSGNIFQYSKNIQEGYESHINTKGVESWRKIYKKGLYAKLEGVSVRDSDFGKEISLYTKLGNGDTAYLNFPLFDQRKNIASYAESLITVLPSLKLGESYRIFPYNIKNEGDKYANIGVSVVLANLENESVLEGAEKPARLGYSYTKDGVEVKGDIPAVVWEEDYTGAKTMNQTAKNKFLYDTLTKHSSAPTGGQAQAAPAAQAKPKASKPAVAVEEENDDLPF
jgi:hypothetical protein